jgi:hypothetical protein
MISIILGLIAFFSFFAFIRNYRLFFLILAVFSLSIQFDFFLIHKETPYVQLKGIPIGLFDLIFLLLLIRWFFQLISRSDKFCFFTKISLPILIYIILAGLSALKSQDTLLSFCMVLLLFKGYLIFLYFANNIKDKKDFSWIVAALSISILLQSMAGIMQYWAGGTLGVGQIFGEFESAFRETPVGYETISRVGGFIGAPNALAMYLNFFLPLLLCFLFTDFSIRYRMLIGIIFLLGGLTEILTFSRGGWVALTFGILIAIYGIFRQRYRSNLKSFVAAGIGILFICIITLGLSQDVRKRLTKDDYGAAYSRIPMMMVAFNAVKANPFTGVGLNNYTTEMNKYDFTRMNISYGFPYPVHNALLIIAAESGLIALLSFMVALFFIFVKAFIFFQAKDRFLSLLGIGFFCGVVTWFIHSLFRINYLGTNNALWFSIGMIIALHRVLLSADTNESVG